MPILIQFYEAQFNNFYFPLPSKHSCKIQFSVDVGKQRLQVWRADSHSLAMFLKSFQEEGSK